ncbi:MAG: proB [Dehalococcoidia bacterium]|nr:proB [Dehalococcoidia bacterium]
MKQPREVNGQGQPHGLHYSRIVVKLGTNVLTGGGDGLDLIIMGDLVAQIAELHGEGAEVLVVTSGAVAAGKEALQSSSDVRGRKVTRKDILFKQVLAAVGQSRLMHYYQQLFDADGIQVAQALVTKGDLLDREGYLNVRNTLEGLLELGVIPIINENDVVDVAELGLAVFGDNDNLSAMIANLVDADLLAIITDIDGLYTADPRRNPKATLIPLVERIDKSTEALAGGTSSNRSRGGMITKIEAAKLATASGVTVVIANGHTPDVLLRLVQGEEIGTTFLPTATRVASRQRWMLSGIGYKGRIVIDDGAAKALATQHRSLLPAGVQGVDGDFGRGDLVRICDSHNVQVGCGLTNYNAGELDKIKGAKSAEILKLLGYRYADEVVHRNDLIMFNEIATLFQRQSGPLPLPSTGEALGLR